jgi:hypothetical protein
LAQNQDNVSDWDDCCFSELALLKKFNTEPSIGASHKMSVHLAKQFQRRRFLEINQSEKRIACGGHVC